MTTKRKTEIQDPPEIWFPRFVEVLGETGNVKLACSVVKVSRQAAYAARKRNPDFRQAWADALEDAGDGLEAEARRRAVVGVESKKLVLYKGEPVIDRTVPGRWVDQYGREWVEGVSRGERRWVKAQWVDDNGQPYIEGISKGRKHWDGAFLYEVTTKYSDSLLTLLLKAAKPDKFADRLKIDQGALQKEAESLAEALGISVEDLVAEIKAIQAEAGVAG